MMSHLRRYFISGLLVLLPIWVTILVVRFFLGILDNSLSMLPGHLQPDNLLGFHIPGLGIVIVLVIILFTGMFVANIIGHKVMAIWHNIINRIPLVRSIYNAVKQMSETVFSSTGQSFRKVYLVEYPRRGMWSIAFQTGDGSDEVKHQLNNPDMLTIFVPTTPNPTSGYLMMIPKEDAIELDMAVEEALKFVISLGVVQPQFNHPDQAKPLEN